MATNKKIEILEEVSRVQRGRLVTTLKKVKFKSVTDGVKKLKQQRARYFEVIDYEKATKKLFKRCLGGKNYEEKVVNIDS